jgi:hypothetical protein
LLPERFSVRAQVRTSDKNTIDILEPCARIKPVHRNAKSSRHRRAALSFVVSVALAIFFLWPDDVMLGIVDQSRASGAEKIRTRTEESFTGNHNDVCDAALDQTAAALSSGILLSRLRFDFKQNLRAWPVLAAGIERSPPPALLSGSLLSITPRALANLRV